MKVQRDVPCLLAVLALGLVLVAPVRAQEESEAAVEPERAGDLEVELGLWVAQPVGLDFRPAMRLDPLQPFQASVLEPELGTEGETTSRLTYHLPGNVGAVAFDYYAHESNAELSILQPGSFIFGELYTLANSTAGFALDAQADGFDSTGRTTLRDWRIEFRRPAFRGARASGEWFVGWRRIDHTRSEEASYFALAPDLPSLTFFDPYSGDPQQREDLLPQPDRASRSSRFEGRGPTVGLDLDFPILQDRLWFEGGASFGILRGDTEARYFSSTAAYALGDGTILGPPYEGLFTALYDTTTGEFDCDPSRNANCALFVDNIFQTVARAGLRADGLSTSAQVVEGQLGLRWRARPWLDVFGGFRASRYDGIGVYLEPGAIEDVSFGVLPLEKEPSFIIGVTDIEENDLSVTYEGFYGGVTLYLF